MNNQKGMSTSMVMVSIIVLILLLGGGSWYVLSQDEVASENEGAMMENDNKDSMESHKDETSIEAGGEVMMKKDGDSMSTEGHEDTMMKDESSFKGAVIAGSSSPLLEYNQRDYESALTSERLVVLYFYANWCPLCRAEFIQTKSAFDELTDENVVGFRIHFNDGDVTPEMEGLAREFGVAYQHTKVFIKNGERVLKSPETWTKERYLTEFTNHIN